MSKPDILLQIINKAFDYSRKGLSAEAVREFSGALALTKEKTVVKDICYQLALCYFEMQNYKEAAKYLQKALKNIENNADTEYKQIYTLLILAYKHLNYNDELIKAYKDILETCSPEDDIYNEALSIVLEIYDSEEKYDEGLKLIEKAYRDKIENKSVFVKKVKFLSQKEDMESSLNAGLEFEKKFGFNFEVYQAIGRAYGFYRVAHEVFKYMSGAYDSLDDEIKNQKSMDSVAFDLLDVLLSCWPYYEGCSKEYIIELVKRKYEITSEFEKNTKFNIALGFFKKLKIGYLSPELHNHPVGEFVMPVMANRNLRNSKNICYSLLPPKKYDNPVTEYIMKYTGEWHDLYGKNDDQLEEFVLADKPDILLELMSVSKNNKLKLHARRLAPLQVSWIGFPVPSGVKAVDYVIADKYTDPPGMTEDYYTEKILRLPDTFLCHLPTYSNKTGEIPYLKNGFITFGCFNNCQKITDRMLTNWNSILRGVKNSRLILKSNFYEDAITLKLFKERMIWIGFDMRQVDFEGSSDFDLYLNKYNEVDILLDTYPFNGATTTFDAFFMGVPLVALTGKTHVSRVSLGMLINVGLDDLAVYTDEEYVNKAISLAADTERLIKIKSTLREIKMKSKLSDVAAFRAEYEHVMRRIWIDYCKENRNHPVYGGLSLEELSDSLVNGSYYICKLIEDDENILLDEALLDEYINLQRVFTRRLSKLWEGNEDKAEILTTCHGITKLAVNLRAANNKDVYKLLDINRRFIIGNSI